MSDYEVTLVNDNSMALRKDPCIARIARDLTRDSVRHQTPPQSRAAWAESVANKAFGKGKSSMFASRVLKKVRVQHGRCSRTS